MLPLNEVIDFLAGYAFKSSAMTNNAARYQLIKMSNVYKSELRLDRNPSYWSDLDPKLNKFILQKNDVVLTLTGTVNKRDYGYSVSIPEGDQFLLNQRLVRLRAIDQKSTHGFVRQIVLTNRFFHHFFFSSKGGTGNQSNVGIEDLKDIELYLPTLSEQRKIADFLTAVDGRIGQLIQKKALLEDYKKGVMQQLFTQAIRFKDKVNCAARENALGCDHGNDFPDWEEKKLGEFLSFKNGYNAAKEQYGTGKKFINVLDIIENDYITHERIIGEVDISPKDFEKNEVKFGDILFQRSSETREEVGQANVYLDRDKKSTFGGFVIRGRPLVDFNPVYFNSMLKTSAVRKDMTSRSGGSTRYNIGQESLEEVPVKIAPSLDEQTKIADFLSAIDRKIESVATQITETQTFKRGLLQQMFV